eukprot:gene15056-biopygen13481
MGAEPLPSPRAACRGHAAGARGLACGAPPPFRLKQLVTVQLREVAQLCGARQLRPPLLRLVVDLHPPQREPPRAGTRERPPSAAKGGAPQAPNVYFRARDACVGAALVLGCVPAFPGSIELDGGIQRRGLSGHRPAPNCCVYAAVTVPSTSWSWVGAGAGSELGRSWVRAGSELGRSWVGAM